MRPRLRAATPFAFLLGGFLLWAAAFLAIYMVQATGCRLGWDEVDFFGIASAQRAVLVTLFLVACGMHIGLLGVFKAAAGARSPFALEVGRILAAAALAASVFCFAGVFWLTACR